MKVSSINENQVTPTSSNNQRQEGNHDELASTSTANQIPGWAQEFKQQILLELEQQKVEIDERFAPIEGYMVQKRRLMLWPEINQDILSRAPTAKRRKISKRVIWTLVIIALSIGLACHLYWNGAEYFEYKVTSEVLLDKEKVIHLPNMTTCWVPKVDWTLLTDEERKKILTTDNGKVIYPFEIPEGERESYFENLTSFMNQDNLNIQVRILLRLSELSNERYYNVTGDHKDLLLTVNTLVPSGFTFDNNITSQTTSKTGQIPSFANVPVLELEKVFSLNMYRQLARTCVDWDVRKEFNDWEAWMNAQVNNGALVSLKFYYKLWSTMSFQFSFVLLGKGDRYFPSIQHEFNPTARGISNIISYDKYVSELLPAPFEANCRDYFTEGMGSQASCVMDCQKRETVARNNTILASSRYDLNDTLDVCPMAEKHCQKLLEIVSPICQRHCSRQDCLSVYYSIRKQTTRNLTDEEQFQIALYSPTERTVRVKSTQSISLGQLMVNLGSTISSWTGLTVVAVVLGINKVISLVFMGGEAEKKKKRGRVIPPLIILSRTGSSVSRRSSSSSRQRRNHPTLIRSTGVSGQRQVSSPLAIVVD